MVDDICFYLSVYVCLCLSHSLPKKGMPRQAAQIKDKEEDVNNDNNDNNDNNNKDYHKDHNHNL